MNAPSVPQPPAAPQRRRRGHRTWAVALGVTALFGSAIGYALTRENWNPARPLVEWAFARATGRQLDIAGDLRVRLGRSTIVRVDEVRVGNARWGRAPALASIDRLVLSLRPLSVLRGERLLERVEAGPARVALERHADGRGNWMLRGDGGAPNLPPWIALRDVALTLVDPRRPDGFRLDLARLESRREGSTIRIEGRGTYQEQPIDLVATLHGLPRRGGGRTPVVVRAASGATRVQAEGWIGGPGEAERFSAQTRFSGASLGDVWRLVGFPLPRSPAYAIEGRLSGGTDGVHFRDFAGQLGKSDVAGDLSVALPRGGRMRIDADLRSREMDLDDFEGFWGRTPREERSDVAAPPGSAGSIFPDVPFDFAKLRVADARVRFAAGRIRGKTVLDRVRLDATLDRGRLELRPLSLGTSAGELSARAVLDARGPRSRLDADLVVRGVELDLLMRRLGRSEDAGGELGGRASLRSEGGSLRELAKAVDGEVGLVLQDGWISDPFLELLALHLGGYLRARLDRDDPAPVRCLVGVFDAREGVLDARSLLLDTRHVRIEGRGEIDLARERIDLELAPHAKHLTFGALGTPIEIQGPLATRRARLKPGPLVARGGAAAALALLHPAAALLALVQPGSDDKPGACREALAEYRPIAAGAEPAPPDPSRDAARPDRR